MITLDTVNRSLEVVLGGAVTTNQLPIVATYVDVTATTYTPATNTTQTNNTTAVTAVAAPAASTQRQIKFLSVRNADTVAATVIVQYNDNSTLREIVRFTLDISDVLLYTDGEGFRVFSSAGALKQGTSLNAGGSDGEIMYNSGGILEGSSAFTFDESNLGLTVPLIFPASDSITAFQLMRADGTTPVVTFDSTNQRLGIGTAAPNAKLEVVASSGTVIRIQNTATNALSGIQMYDSSGNQRATFGWPNSTADANIRNSFAILTFDSFPIKFITNYNASGVADMVLDTTGFLGVGIVVPVTQFHTILNNSTTNAVDNVVTIGHNSTGTPAAGFGAGMLFTLESSTTADQSAGRVTYEWVVATHASRTARSKWTVYDTAEREAIRIEASGSAPMIGAYGVAAVARPSAYTQTYSTADKTLGAYTADNESGAYTGIDNLQVGSVYATVADLNALRTAYENLRAFMEDGIQFMNSMCDDLQSEGWLQ